MRPVARRGILFRVAVMAGVVVMVPSCQCGDGEGGNPVTPGPSQNVGRVSINTSTIGLDLPTGSYTVDLGSLSRAVGINAQAIFEAVPPGTYTLSLAGLPINCADLSLQLPSGQTVANQSTIQITVTSGGNDVYTFTIECSANVGGLNVTTTTNDPFGIVQEYRVSVGGETMTIPATGAVEFPDLAPGTYEVELLDVPGFCTVDTNPATTTVAFGTTASASFSVVCMGDATVRLVTQTQGVDLDPDGYTVIGLFQPIDIGINDALEVDVLDDDYTLELTGLATNCSVDGENPRTVDVGLGSTTEVVFAVSCQGPPPACTTTSEPPVTDMMLGSGWAHEVTYQTHESIHWGVTSGQTPHNRAGIEEGDPPPARWVNLTLQNPDNVNVGVGAASFHPGSAVSIPIASIQVSFRVWAQTVRMQAIIKQNGTTYGIPMGDVVTQAQGWRTIETVCGVPEGIFKVGGQLGTGPDHPTFTEPFEVGYISQASGIGDNQDRMIIVDNWSVTVWR